MGAEAVIEKLQLGADDAVGVAGSTVAVKASIPTGLKAAGFTAAGVAKGSIAALHWMATFGGHIASGSLFAFCQSLAAGSTTLGTGPVVVTGLLVWVLARYPSRRLRALAADDVQLLRLPQPVAKLWRQAIEMVLMGRGAGRAAVP